MATMIATGQWIEPALASAGLAAVLGVAGCGLLVWRRERLAGTTLVAPWYWAIVTLLAVSASEVAIGIHADTGPPAWAGVLRFVAAASTFCPVMAVLGAKRPQDRPWQFIVFSLWVTLVMPAGQAWLMHPGQELVVHGVRAWFLLALIVVTALNGLPTRFWISVVLYCLAQITLFAEHLPLVRICLGTAGAVAGLSLIVAAVALVGAGIPRRGHAARPLDRLWLDFRNMFGAAWGLRVAQRINALATRNGWNITLRWSGFCPSAEAGHDREMSQDMSPETTESLHKSLKNILRRFVSPEWIAIRLGQSIEDSNGKR